MAIYAIGDVQGCARELDDLLVALDFSPSRDECWLVGDLVNRGDESLNVIKRVLALGASARCVLGNHDLHCLAVGFGVTTPKPSDTFHDILNDKDRQVWLEFLLRQPLIQENTDWLMVHAGIPPTWDLAEIRAQNAAVQAALRADPVEFLSTMYGDEPTCFHPHLTPSERQRFTVNAFTRMRYVGPTGEILSTPKGPPSDAPAGLTPWYLAKRAPLGKKIVFGHWSALGLYQDANVLCLDTGCAWGHTLTAQQLDAATPTPPIQVPCRGAGKSFD
jgi:bis(5'-nucleosyl)-tetraphosphatase (symmetrical)